MKSINGIVSTFAIFTIFLGFSSSSFAMQSSNTLTGEKVKKYFAERHYPDIKVKEIMNGDSVNSFLYFDGPTSDARAQDFSSMLSKLFFMKNSTINDVDGIGIILTPTHKRQLYIMITVASDLSRVEKFYRGQYDKPQLKLTKKEDGIYVFSSPDKIEMNNLISSLIPIICKRGTGIGDKVNLNELTIDLYQLTRIYKYILDYEGEKI